MLVKEPDGLRHSVLVERLEAALPDIPLNTIRGTVVGLIDYKPDQVYKPAKGLFQHTNYRNGSEPFAPEVSVPVAVQSKEQDFYAGFAEYLTEDLEECSKAVPLGGCVFKDKWGTPDVIGIQKPLLALLQSEPEPVQTLDQLARLGRGNGGARPPGTRGALEMSRVTGIFEKSASPRNRARSR